MFTRKGTFTAPTVNGSTSVVNGLGFTPKVVIFWTTGQTATGISASSNAMLAFGAASSSSDQGWCGFAADHSPTTMNTGKSQRDDSCIGLLTTGTPTADARATMTTLGTTSFTITWTDAPTAAILVHWMALGGSDITNVKVGKTTIPTAGAPPFNSDTTTVGFQPTSLILFGCRQGSAALNATSVHAQFHIGATDGTTQWGQAIVDPDNVGTSTSASTYSASQIVRAFEDTTTVTIDMQATFSSFLANGFRLSVTNTPATADVNVFYIAFNAASAVAVGNETKPTSSTTKKTTISSFHVSAGLCFTNTTSADDGTATTNTASGAGIAAQEIGGFTALTSGMSGAYTDDAAATAICCKRHATTDVMFMGDPATTATTLGTAALSAIHDDGFTLNWTGADATARRFGYVAFKANTVPVPTLRDNFNRADGALGASWTSPWDPAETNAAAISTNKMVSSASWSEDYWNTLFQDTQGSFYTLSAAWAGTQTNVTLWVVNAGLVNYGYVGGNYIAAGGGVSTFEKSTGGAEVGLNAEFTTFVPASADVFGATVDSSKLVTVWVKRIGGWVDLCTGTATVSLPGSSYMGIEGDASQGFDDFSTTGSLFAGAVTVKNLSALGVG